jgi:hypothetical protein
MRPLLFVTGGVLVPLRRLLPERSVADGFEMLRLIDAERKAMWAENVFIHRSECKPVDIPVHKKPPGRTGAARLLDKRNPRSLARSGYLANCRSRAVVGEVGSWVSDGRHGGILAQALANDYRPMRPLGHKRKGALLWERGARALEVDSKANN